jgi:UDP-N-acetylmuramoyl-tripeptide--D-alanyl-D-alanine ligase
VRDSHGAAILPAFTLPGRHNLHNLLAAIALARSMEVSWEQITLGMNQLSLPERRLQHIEKGGVLFVNDAYNASPVSMKAALASLPTQQPGGKRIAMLGDMLELGPHSESSHRDIGIEAFKYVDNMICVGPHCGPIVESWKAAKRPVAWFLKLDEAVAELKKQMRKGDVVLLKASRSLGLNRVIDMLGECS